MGPGAAAPSRRRATGWIPEQHGAWEMLALPVVVGVWLVGATWVHLALAAFWLVGYLAFDAASRWLRSRRRRREPTPVLVYGTATLPLGLLTLVLVAYFLGTALYVKTMIRERGRPG